MKPFLRFAGSFIIASASAILLYVILPKELSLFLMAIMFGVLLFILGDM